MGVVWLQAPTLNGPSAPSGWKVDFIVRKSRPFSLAEFDRRRSVELLGTPLRIATAEDVLIAKLEWAKLGA